MISCSVLGLILISICVLMDLFSPVARANPVTGGEQQRLERSYLNLPVFRHFRKPRVDKRHFAPAHVKSRESLPEHVRQILVPAPRRRLKSRVKPNGPVSVTCSPTEMRVRVQTAHLGEGVKRVHARLGTCDVSSSSGQSVVFEYELQQCGTQRQILNNTIVYSNVLHYTPSVWGSGTFSIPVQCRFNRFHYSYKIGFVPSVKSLKLFKPMKMKGSVTLTACDAQWNRLPPDEGFVAGQPMFFEAETLYMPDDKRLFLHFCHVTTNSARVSTPQVNIISNYGCLIVSRSSSQSRFISSTRRNIVRFTIDAFTLQGKVQNYLFIHCEMSIRSVVPTATSKSCTYNRLEHRWEELYGADSVCSCCDSSCVPEIPTLMRPLTSELGALMKQTPEGKRRNVPTPSTEGISTQETEPGTLTTEIQHKTTVPERTRTLEHEHTATTTERTPAETMHVVTIPLALEDKQGTLVPDGEYRIIPLEEMQTPASDHATPTPASDHATPASDHATPASDHATPTAASDHATPASDHATPTAASDHATPASDHATPTPASDHATPASDHATPTPASDHATPTPASDHATPTPARDHATPTPASDNSVLTPKSDHGVTSESRHAMATQESDHTSPTPEGDRWTLTESIHGTLKPKNNHRKITTVSTHTPGNEHRTVLPDSEHGTLIPDTEREKIPPQPDEVFSHGVVYKHSELQEPYRIFEEVFGLS